MPHNPNTRPVVLGTAGHVDHGKTALVKALTGVDCDRLKEEKERGITIELGFARLVTPSDIQISVIDVPGHEKFVRTMIAGAGGIDIALLVIAADEGIKPQTIEHVSICGVLGIPRGIVAISKRDLVSNELIDTRRKEVRSAFKGSIFESAPCVAVSATTGEGLPDLVSAIERVSLGETDAARTRRDALPSRLYVDRVFSMAGFGAVVTGTLLTGKLSVGDEIVLLPGETAARIRGLEVHGERVETVESGVRVAINVQGLPKEAIRRGDAIVAPGKFFETQTIDVEIVHLPFAENALLQNARLGFHLGTANAIANVRLVGADCLDPGQRGFAQIFLDRPMVVAGGDRFVLRGTEVLLNHGKTVGGGGVLDARAPVIRKRSRVDKVEWSRLNSDRVEERIRVIADRASRDGFDTLATRTRLGITGAEWAAGVASLVAAGQIARVERESSWFISTKVLTDLLARLIEEIKAFHRAFPLKTGLSEVELMQRLNIKSDAIMDTVVYIANRENRIEWVDGFASLPGRAQESKDWTFAVRASICAYYRERGLASPRVREVSAALKIPVPTLEQLITIEVASGRLVRVAAEVVAPFENVKDLEHKLVDHLKRNGSISTQEFKDLCGLSRKYTIPLAEYFDSRRVTLRVGEKRVARS
ncbi:MAG: selenocysteine-specific translation elongation factor [Deltaproteobacteria bacterium]|nr:selenocysteine-specific translation elongation factor [Deltaproteobacteria bacterium]